MTNPIIYGLMGFGVAIYSNSVRKLPLMRRPWEHLMIAGGAVYLGSCMEAAQVEIQKRLEEGTAQIDAERAAREEKFAAYHAAQKAKEQQSDTCTEM